MLNLRSLGHWSGLLLLLAGCGGDDTQPGQGSAGSDTSSGGNAMTSSGGAAGSNAAGNGGTSVGAGGGGAGAASLPEGGSVTNDGAVTDALSTSDAGSGPLTIFTGAGKPTGIALSATAVYWADEAKGTISTCPKTGCGASAPTVVVTTPAPRGIALRGTTLYWISAGQADASIGASAMKCTLGACAANQSIDLGLSSTGGPYGSMGIAADDQRFYAVGGPAIVTCPVAGCGDAGRGQLGGVFMGPIFGIAVDSTTSYSGRWFGGVSTCPLSGCSSPEDETRIVNSPPTMGIAVDSTNVYWAEYSYLNATPQDGAIRTCGKEGCDISAAKVLAAGSFFPYALAVDDANLYFTDNLNGRVERVSKSDFGHTCASTHLSACTTCTGLLKCDGTCNVSCDAGTD